MATFADEVVNRTVKLSAQVGRGALNALYPSDFEVYLMSLELVKINDAGKEEVMNFFSFPIMPSSITQTEPQITNIKKTVGGITILNTNSFIVKDLVLQGNFGRNFKILINGEKIDFKGLVTNPKQALSQAGQALKKKVSDAMDLKPGVFSNTVKTGYGCTKILQAICDSSVEIDNGKPRRLYLHNPALGESHLVKVTSFTLAQNLQSNMIWGYTLQLKLISPIENIRGSEENSLKKTFVVGSIQNSINQVAGFAVKVLSI